MCMQASGRHTGGLKHTWEVRGFSSAIGRLLGKLSSVLRVSKFSGRVIESAGTVRFDRPWWTAIN